MLSLMFLSFSFFLKSLPPFHLSFFLSVLHCVTLSSSLLNTGMGDRAIPTPTSLPEAQDHPPAPGREAGTTMFPLPVLIQEEAAGSLGPETPCPQR